MPERVVITGGTGFLGRHLCNKFASTGFHVTAVTDTNDRLDGIETVKADVLDYSACQAYIGEADIVIHLAAITEHDAIVGRPFETLQLNYEGTRNVLKCFNNSKGKFFIFPSTGKVYGKPDYLPYDEEHQTKPTTVLGKSKLISERLIDFHAMFAKVAKSFAIMRIFNVYGPMQKETFLIPTIIRQLDLPEITLGDLDSKRDYIYIDDVVSAFLAVAQKKSTGLTIYNVGSGRSYSPRQISGMFDKITGTAHVLKSDEMKKRTDEFDEERVDNGRLERLGWKISVDMETGLKRTLESMKKV